MFNNKKRTIFLEVLEDTIKCAEEQKEKAIHGETVWDSSLLERVVLPELKNLLLHFKNGEKYFNYGKRQRMLESTYFVTDRLENLWETELGSKLSRLQELYDRL